MPALLSETNLASPLSTEIQPGVWLDSRLAMWLARERLLVIADLHWSYAASHRARGNLLPIWGDDNIEQRLRGLLDTYRPAEMLWLGDVIHAAEGGVRADAFVRTSPVPITLLAGNHDRRWRSTGLKSVQRGNFFFHHGDTAMTVPPDCIEVIGHHHPAIAMWDRAGGSVKVPAFVARARRFVLPAFSPWAAGTPWVSVAGTQETLWAMTPSRIFAVNKGSAAKTAISA